MGDRCILWVNKASAAIYLHWAGGRDGVAQILDEAAGTLRQGDPDYAQARLIAAACRVHNKYVTGVGVLPAPSKHDQEEDYEDYSHGDCGVGVIDDETGKIEWFAGYLSTEDEHNENGPVLVELTND